MIIGQFCDTYPPTLDGVGRVMLNYCEALGRKGHRTVYVAPKNPRSPDEDMDCETLLYPSLPIPKQQYRFGEPLFGMEYRKAILNIPFDILHAHCPFCGGQEARRIARYRGAPLVATFHSKYYDDFYKATTSKTLAKIGVDYAVRFFRSCDEVWTVNQKTAEVLESYGYKGEIFLMPNGTDILPVTDDDRRRAREAFPMKDGVPILMFAGQQDFKKNIRSVLDACKLLSDSGVDYHLLMVGDGPNFKAIRDIAQRIGIGDNVTFAGFVGDQPMLRALYERADLFVFPSIYDSAPMVVREAAAMGTPSLLIEGSCSAEGMEHDNNAFLCYNTPADIAQCIRRALPLCEKVGLRAKETIPLPWNQLMDRVLARYNALIDSKR